MISHYLLFGAALFAVGSWGVIVRRNLLIVLMSLELMLNGVNVALVAVSLKFPGAPVGQVFVLMVMAVAAAEVAVGLAIVIAAFRTRQTVDIHDFRSLRG